ncbi:hypothetical protein HPB47_013021 [Ixodes persulcatus]|uniref:Uncharacterized protein n=1 Tax=Ixodes persulcatus TaxID=34615 RepID=A0AC60NRY2_IXOPE|nr:hypothetical protein HPB47_013021 [Ixodes persulcatus]
MNVCGCHAASSVAGNTRDTPHPDEAPEDEPFEEQRRHNHRQLGHRHRSCQTQHSGWHLNKDCRLCVSSTYVFFLAAGMIVACTAYVGGYVASYQSNRSARNDPKNVVCRSPVCKEVAKSIARSLNRSVDPCKNFYNFVCDGWRRKHPVRRNEVRSSPFSLVGRELDNVIKKALNDVPITGRKQSALEKAALMYKKCLENYEQGDSSASMKVLKELLGYLHMPWPTVDSKSPVDLFEIIIQLSLRWSIPSLFSVSVIPDPEDTRSNVLVFNTMENLEVGFHEVQSGNATKNDTQDLIFMKMVQKIAAILGGNQTNYKTLAENVVMAPIVLASVKHFHFDVLGRTDAWPPKKYQIQHLESLTPQVSSKRWLSTLNRYLPENVQVKETNDVIVMSPGYLWLVTSLIQQNNTVRMFQDFIGWSIAFLLGPLSSREIREAVSNYGKELGMDFTNVDKEKLCRKDVEDYLPMPYGAIFVQSYTPDYIKDDAKVVVDHIKLAFAYALRLNSWMDDQTRTRAMAKVQRIISHVAYPDWIKNMTELDESHADIPNIDGPYVKILMELKEVYTFRSLSILRQTNTRDEEYWTFSPATLNAFYEHSTNSITIPAAILNYPFYSYGLPPAMNYGSIGAIIGHEISHAFDTLGSHFDDNGNLRNWWTRETKGNFVLKNYCFVLQYNSIYEPHSKRHLNGKQTLSENIADNGGLRQSFHAYRLHVDEHPGGKEENIPLEGLEEFTPDQLFFISSAYKWCADTNPKAVKMIMNSDSHSLEEYRCNVAVENMVEFSKAFQCGNNEEMNPAKKCVVW